MADEEFDSVETVTEDNEDRRVVRTDRYRKDTKEWVGNDVHVTLKKVPALFGEQANFI